MAGIRSLAVSQYDEIPGSIGAEWEQWLPEIKADHSVKRCQCPLQVLTASSWHKCGSYWRKILIQFVARKTQTVNKKIKNGR
jgi:hypothetical protein